MQHCFCFGLCRSPSPSVPGTVQGRPPPGEGDARRLGTAHDKRRMAWPRSQGSTRTRTRRLASAAARRAATALAAGREQSGTRRPAGLRAASASGLVFARLTICGAATGEAGRIFRWVEVLLVLLRCQPCRHEPPRRRAHISWAVHADPPGRQPGRRCRRCGAECVPPGNLCAIARARPWVLMVCLDLPRACACSSHSARRPHGTLKREGQHSAVRTRKRRGME